MLDAFRQALRPALVVRTRDFLKSPAEIDAMVSHDLTDDPVFGRMNGLTIEDFAGSRARREVAGTVCRHRMA